MVVGIYKTRAERRRSVLRFAAFDCIDKHILFICLWVDGVCVWRLGAQELFIRAESQRDSVDKVAWHRGKDKRDIVTTYDEK